MNSLIIARNIIKRVFKSPKSIIGLLVLPIVVVFIIVFALGSAKETTPKIGIVNLDNGSYSQHIVDYIEIQDIDLTIYTEDNYLNEVKNKTVDYVIIIPKDFSTELSLGNKVNLIFTVNKKEDIQNDEQVMNQYLFRLYTAMASAKQIAQETGEDIESIVDDIMSNLNQGQLQVQYKLAGKSEGSTVKIITDPTIGFVVMFMMVLIFTSIGIILEDKKKLVLARMFVSPVKEYEIILGNIIGSLILGFIQLIPLMITLKFSYHIVSMEEMLGLFVVLFCFLIAIVGIGIGISGLIKKAFNPSILLATVITPSSIIGGCLIPSSMLPSIVNKIGYIVPQKWVMLSIEAIFSGNSLGSIHLNLLIILMFGVVFSTFGLKTLRPLSE